MVQINFLNAKARDDGYGLEVNGHKLEDIISVALGVFPDIKSAENTRYDVLDRKKKRFNPPFCNISITIDPINPQTSSTICFEDSEEEKQLEEILEGVHGDDEEIETGSTEE